MYPLCLSVALEMITAGEAYLEGYSVNSEIKKVYLCRRSFVLASQQFLGLVQYVEIGEVCSDA